MSPFCEIKFGLIGRDKVGGVMETRLSRELDFKLIDAYLKLEPSQLDKPKIQDLFRKVNLTS
jgi:hypothetical protein